MHACYAGLDQNDVVSPAGEHSHAGPLGYLLTFELDAASLADGVRLTRGATTRDA